MSDSDTRKCPFCAEIIKLEAIKCKHCFSDLTKANKTDIDTQAQDHEIIEKSQEEQPLSGGPWQCDVCGEESDNNSRRCWKCGEIRVGFQDILKKENRMQLENYLRDDKWGQLNTSLVCPHCQSRGTVRIKLVKRKKGISGAKATGAILTLGWSMLATGLSRKETQTQAHCEQCNSTWDF